MNAQAAQHAAKHRGAGAMWQHWQGPNRSGKVIFNSLGNSFFSAKKLTNS